jgi:hypothetical protein
MLRLAQTLRGSRPAPAADEFVERLHERIFPQSRKISRRAAFLSGLGALAAGLVAGVGLDHALQPASPNVATGGGVIIPDNGQWHPVALLSELPEGAVKSFTVGAMQGFFVRRTWVVP